MNAPRQCEGVDPRRIEEACLNGLQTQRQLFHDGWLLRVSPGKAKRARSVNAFFGSTLPLEGKIDYCERLYARRGLPMLFRVTPFDAPPELDAALAARGYEAFGTTRTQVMRLSQPPSIRMAEDVGIVVPAAEQFVTALGAFQHSSPEQCAAHLERLAATPLATRSVLALHDGQPVGTGSVALEDGLAGIYSVATAPALRGRGVATSILGALLSWAWEHSATHAFLQVEADNLRALSLYRGFGFADAYAYHYRGRPGECE
jgi:ribosomal protein S18 acetylase RimI-like enzyme